VGFFSAPEVDPRLEAVLIGRTSSDLKAVAKAQAGILAALAPDERIIFVSASELSPSSVWMFTDRRLLESSGKHVSYDLPISRIAETNVRYTVMVGGRSVRYIGEVRWSGGPLRTVDGKFANDNGFLLLDRMNGEVEVRRIISLVDANLST
jgi:hypothetical protein